MDASWRELLSGADSFNDNSSHFSRSFDGLSTFLHQNESLLARLKSEQICLWVRPSCITIRRTSFAHAVQFGSLGRTTSPSLSAASSYMLIIFPQMNSAQVKSSWLPHCRFAALYTTASGCRDRNSSAEPCSSGCEASGQEGFISDGSVVDFTDGSPQILTGQNWFFWWIPTPQILRGQFLTHQILTVQILMCQILTGQKLTGEKMPLSVVWKR